MMDIGIVYYVFSVCLLPRPTEGEGEHGEGENKFIIEVIAICNSVKS